jgi:hypothetical protein
MDRDFYELQQAAAKGQPVAVAALATYWKAHYGPGTRVWFWPEWTDDDVPQPIGDPIIGITETGTKSYEVRIVGQPGDFTLTHIQPLEGE